ncbi:hypothetical protein WN944_009706 [Citrus x changshan-huyou]|uniref:Uncharacterized protein n=1 Tax=Citrus x changshan-huyou TaxID=2935761 RepID=A0AAP0MQA7_9ROSI
MLSTGKNKESLERRALLKEEDHTEPTVMNITTSGSTLEVNLICGSNRNFMFHEIISVLEEGAAEVINVTQFNSGDRVIFSVLSKLHPCPSPAQVSTQLTEKLKRPSLSKFGRAFEALGLRFNNVGLGLNLKKSDSNQQIANPTAVNSRIGVETERVQERLK